jgi:hypothetical protein
VITLSSLPPIDVGDEIEISGHTKLLGGGPVLRVDDGGIAFLRDGIGSTVIWVPYSAIAYVSVREGGQAAKLVNDYRRIHSKES